MYDYDVIRNGCYAWNADKSKGTISTVKAVCGRENILYTRYSYVTGGGLFDQQLLKKGNGQLPIKGSDPRLTIENYGGYNKISGAYYFLVEHELKGKKVRTIEYVPVYLARKIEENPAELEKYAADIRGLINPDIRIRKIKTNTLFKNNGFLMHIAGRTGDRLVFRNAVELRLDKEQYAYCKSISKYIERAKVSKSDLAITGYDGITAEKNITLYDTFLDKLCNSVYKVPFKKQLQDLTNEKEKFVALKLEEQTKVLFEILHLFQCNRTSSDLTFIGGSKQAGNIMLGKDITHAEKLFIVNQSPTGIFEQVTDLKTI